MGSNFFRRNYSVSPGSLEGCKSEEAKNYNAHFAWQVNTKAGCHLVNGKRLYSVFCRVPQRTVITLTDRTVYGTICKRKRYGHENYGPYFTGRNRNRTANYDRIRAYTVTTLEISYTLL